MNRIDWGDWRAGEDDFWRYHRTVVGGTFRRGIIIGAAIEAVAVLVVLVIWKVLT